MDWRGVQISVDKGANPLIILGMYGAERGLLVVRCVLRFVWLRSAGLYLRH